MLLAEQQIDRLAAQCRQLLAAIAARMQAVGMFVPHLAARHRLARLREAAAANPADGARCAAS